MNYELIVQRKNIKHIYLRVKYPNIVLVTCSHRVDEKRIDSLICEKERWIEGKLLGLSNESHSLTIQSGSTLRLADERYRIELLTGSRNRLTVCERNICLTLTDSSDDLLAQKLLLTWYRKEFCCYLQSRSEEIVTANSRILHHIPKRIAVRDMHTRWGSYSRKTDTMAFSLRLGAYGKSAIDSVICHELAHTLQMNHQAQFYRILYSVMPDYKEAGKELKQKKPVQNWFLCE